MRAENESPYIRPVLFVGGFPTTMVSYACIKEGSQIVYGMELPHAQEDTDTDTDKDTDIIASATQS